MNIEFDYELKCNQQCEEIIVFFDIVFSAIAMVLSMGISLFFAYKHLRNYSNPFFQDKIVGFSSLILKEFIVFLLIFSSDIIYGTFLRSNIIFRDSFRSCFGVFRAY